VKQELLLIPLRYGVAKGYKGFSSLMIKMFGYPSWNRQLEAKALFTHINFEKHAHIVDVGCGSGMLSGELAFQGYNVVGVDVDVTRIRVAATRYRDIVDFVVSDANSLPFKDGSVDGIIALSSVEHFHNLGQFLESAYLCLKQSGQLAIITDIRSSSTIRWKFVPRFLMNSTVKKMVEDGVSLDEALYEHHKSRYNVVHYYSLNDLLLFSNAGFHVATSQIIMTGLWSRLFEAYCVLLGLSFTNTLHRTLSLFLNLLLWTDKPEKQGKSILLIADKAQVNDSQAA